MPRGALLDLHPHRKATGLWDECILDDASPEAELAVCRKRRVRVRVTKRAVRVTSERSSNEEWAKEAREAKRARAAGGATKLPGRARRAARGRAAGMARTSVVSTRVQLAMLTEKERVTRASTRLDDPYVRDRLDQLRGVSMFA